MMKTANTTGINPINSNYVLYLFINIFNYSRIHPPNNNVETCSSPPFKRFKRFQRQTDQDEDNLSDMSQDE